MKNLASAIAILVLSGTANYVAADDNAPVSQVTFTKDVLPIMQKNCQGCHRPAGLNLGGMIAPMAFTSYEEVRPWVKSIAQKVQARQMPPWHASMEQHGIFLNERTLTDQEVATISRWVETGAPKGEPKDAPAPIKWPEAGWSIGKPDLIVPLDQPFMVKDEIEDLNIDLRATVTPEQLPEDRYIIGIEFRPGSDVVHHIIASAIQDNGSGGRERVMIGGMAPGTEPDMMPEGYGALLKKGVQLVFQMHYHKNKGPGTGKMDRSEIGLKFSEKGKPINRVFMRPIGDTMRLKVPAGDPNYRITSAKVYDRDTTFIALLPHMHLRGVYSKYIAFYPDGKQETLLETPHWSFSWQTLYKYREPKKIPAGTRVEVTLGYDNSKSNPANPDPNIDVVWGQPTTAEMNLGWVWWAYTNPTDKDQAPSIGRDRGPEEAESL